MDRIRIALIGAGGISEVHARAMLAHPDKVECVALCDVSEAGLEKRAAQLGTAPRLFRDWKAMLAEFGHEIDAVDICLPHHLHAPAILDAAAAGKHVLCEKPLCTDLAEADRIVEAVRSAGIIYMSAHNQLFKPVVGRAKELIGQGLIGKVRWIRSQDCFRVALSNLSGTWRSQVKTQGGGVLIDTGYHPTYRLLHLAGTPVEAVRGTMANFQRRIEGEDTAAVQVRFAGGTIGEILTSWSFSAPYGSHKIHVIGEQGELFGSGHRLFHLAPGFTTPSEQILPEVDEFSAQMAHFAACVRNGAKPLHGVEEGRDVLRVIIQAGQNAEGWQKIPGN